MAKPLALGCFVPRLGGANPRYPQPFSQRERREEMPVSCVRLILPLAAMLALAACNNEKAENKRTNSPADSTTTTNPANPSNQNAPQPSAPPSR